MLGSTHPMNPLETRKRLLLAESDLLRIQLSDDFGLLMAAWRRAGIPARSLSGASPMVEFFSACLSAVGRFRDPGGHGPVSWLGRLVRGIGLVAMLWLGWQRARKSAS